MSNKQAIEKLLLSGYTVEFKKITICKIQSYHYDADIEQYKYGWQVSDLNKCYSFTSIKQAIKKFMDLKERYYQSKRKNSKVSGMSSIQRYPM